MKGRQAKQTLSLEWKATFVRRSSEVVAVKSFLHQLWSWIQWQDRNIWEITLAFPFVHYSIVTFFDLKNFLW